MVFEAFSEIYHGIFKGQWTSLEDTSVNLSGKTVIVTGTNVGLGKVAAGKFASMRPEKLIIAVRTLSKGEAARRDILAENPNFPETAIEAWSLDLGDFDSVKAFAKQLSRLDVLLCNTGIYPAKWETTKDGWENALQTNCLATFNLSLLLLRLIRKTSENHYKDVQRFPNTLSQPHLTIVSSGRHFMSKLPEKSAPRILEAMNDPEQFSADNRYTATKVIEVFFARTLARKTQELGINVIVNSVNPGFCYSSLNDAANEGNAVRRALLAAIMVVVARTTETGARALTWASLRGAELGAYSTDCTDSPPAPFVTSTKGIETEQRLWDEVTEVLLKVDTNIKPILSTL